MPPPVDLPRLAEFSDGTAAGLRTLIDIFLQDSAETAAQLHAAVAAARFAEIELLAHRAGGASGACGAGRLSALLLQLEESARAGTADDAGALMREVASELARVTVYLRGHLDGMDAKT